MRTANGLLGQARDSSLWMKRDHYIFMQDAYKLVIEMRFLEPLFFAQNLFIVVQST
jgi:hypothetical protein